MTTDATGDTVATLRASLTAAEAKAWAGWACCEFHDHEPELYGRCAPDDQGGYCCDDCPTLGARPTGTGWPT